MKNSALAVKSNIIYGIIALIPISIVFLMLVKVVELLETVAESLGLRSVTSAGIIIVLAVLLLFVLCFLIGAFVRTRIGSLSMETLERKILNQIPGYQIISNILKGFLEKKTSFLPALVQLSGPRSAAMGFIMEKNDNGTMTVFVPATPVITMGSVHVVPSDRVTVLDANAMDLLDCISQWGIGSSKILATLPPKKVSRETSGNR